MKNKTQAPTPIEVKEGRHTPGTVWTEVNNPEYIDIETNDGRLCSVYSGEEAPENNKANAARIVECWNGHDQLQKDKKLWYDRWAQTENEKDKFVTDNEALKKQVHTLRRTLMNLKEELTIGGNWKAAQSFVDETLKNIPEPK